MTDFDTACRDFTYALQMAAGWKQNYYGASYSTRISHAIDDLRAACVRMEQSIRDDRKQRDIALTTADHGGVKP
jgi:hypothetical protein